MVSYSDILLFPIAISTVPVLLSNALKLQVQALAVQGLLIAVLAALSGKADLNASALSLGVLSFFIKSLWVPNLFLPSEKTGVKRLFRMSSLIFITLFVFMVTIGAILPIAASVSTLYGAILALTLFTTGSAAIWLVKSPIKQILGAAILENGFFLIGVSFPPVMFLVLVPLLGEVFVFSTFLASLQNIENQK